MVWTIHGFCYEWCALIGNWVSGTDPPFIRRHKPHQVRVKRPPGHARKAVNGEIDQLSGPDRQERIGQRDERRAERQSSSRPCLLKHRPSARFWIVPRQLALRS